MPWSAPASALRLFGRLAARCRVEGARRSACTGAAAQRLRHDRKQPDRLRRPCSTRRARDCSVGDPIPGIEVRFVGLEGVDAAPGEIGELWVRGPNVMLGYYRNDAQTRATVTEDGWLKTGDLARQDADGALHIVGRSKELIIRSGFNVYPAEVENVLNAHPGVVQSAVIGRAVEGNEEVVAFVELRAVARSAAGRYRSSGAATRLAPYKRPAEIRRAGRAAGGIDRQRCSSTGSADELAVGHPFNRADDGA